MATDTRTSLHLTAADHAALERLAGGGSVSQQDLLRGLVRLAAADQAVWEGALALVPAPARANPPGRRRGLTPADYQRALDEAGTIVGAARLLGVHRRTVDEQMVRYKLRRPPKTHRTRIGGHVPWRSTRDRLATGDTGAPAYKLASGPGMQGRPLTLQLPLG